MTSFIDPRVDLYLNGDWQDITLDVRQQPPIKISSGTKNEASKVSPGKCSFYANNPSGDYDPRNPVGQYFGVIGKNTPVRVRVPLMVDNVAQTDTDGWGTVWSNQTGSGGVISPTDWTRAGTVNTHSVPVASAYRRTSVAGKSYMDACLRYTVGIPVVNVTGGAIISQAEFRYVDANNYIAAQFIFTTTETIQVQVLEVIAGVSRVLLGTVTVPNLLLSALDQAFEIAAMIEGQVVRTKVWATGDPEPADWQNVCTRATVRYGLMGVSTILAAGNTNAKPVAVAYGNMTVEARPFVGEISEYVPKVADLTHAAPYVEITASGITQRTEQGSEPLKSTMRRFWGSRQRWLREGAALSVAATGDVNTLVATDADALDVPLGGFCRLLDGARSTLVQQHKEDQLFTIVAKTSAFGFTNIDFTPDALVPIVIGDSLAALKLADAGDDPVAYWPCEDEKNATNVSSGLRNGSPMEYSIATPEFASKDSFTGSTPILKLNNAQLEGTIPDYDDTNTAFTYHFLAHFPAVDEATGQAIVQFYCTGSAEIWALVYSVGGAGAINIRAFDTNGTGMLFDVGYDLGMRGNPSMVTLTLQQTAPTTVTYTLTTTRFASDGTAIISGPAVATATGVTRLGKIYRHTINPGGGYVDVGVGHISVVPAAQVYFELMDYPNARISENIPRRFARLTYEEGVPLVYCQGPVAANTLGVQQRATLLSNLEEAADVDMGRFYESRGAYSFEYRARSSLYNQDPFMAVDYLTGGVLSELVPSDDDKDTRNDITMKRIGGGSYHTTLETGRLSVQKPEDGGVGRYTDAPEVNARLDSDLVGLAEWRLHLGTVDEVRYSSVKLSPIDSEITLEELFSTGVGNRFTISNLEARGIYQPVDLLVRGYTWILHPYVPTLEINGEPASPYQVAVLDDPDVRLDSSTTTLNEDLTTTETGVSVTSSDGTLWISDSRQPLLPTALGGSYVLCRWAAFNCLVT